MQGTAGLMRHLPALRHQPSSQGKRCLGLCRLVAGVLAIGFAMTGASPAFTGERQPVRSLLEMRQHQVVIQEWDLSCGAATLATILTFQHGDAVTEREVALGLMMREEYLENPLFVKQRQGFSFLDMQRYLDSLGYAGRGLGRLDFDDLLDHSPIIVPVSIHGYQHFVVFRGALGDRVLLADPAFGNRTMTRPRFEAAWIDYAEFGHVGFQVRRKDNLIAPNRLTPEPADFVTLR